MHSFIGVYKNGNRTLAYLQITRTARLHHEQINALQRDPRHLILDVTLGYTQLRRSLYFTEGPFWQGPLDCISVEVNVFWHLSFLVPFIANILQLAVNAVNIRATWSQVVFFVDDVKGECLCPVSQALQLRCETNRENYWPNNYSESFRDHKNVAWETVGDKLHPPVAWWACQSVCPAGSLQAMRILASHSLVVDQDQRTWRDHGAGIQTNSDVLEIDSD